MKTESGELPSLKFCKQPNFEDMYDDSHLRRKITCLTSSQVLCFVIGVAALGISIVLLLKFDNDEAHHPSISMAFKNEIADLQKEISELKKQVEEFQEARNVQFAYGGTNRILPSSGIASADGDSAQEDHHHVHPEDQSEEEEQSKTSEEPSKEHHIAGTEGVDKIKEIPLCDDSDLCLAPDGSENVLNSIEDVSEEFYIEGSGDVEEDCSQFPVPICPEGANICFQGETCPIPVCCFTDKPDMHSHHHH